MSPYVCPPRGTNVKRGLRGTYVPLGVLGGCMSPYVCPPRGTNVGMLRGVLGGRMSP